MKLWVMAGVLVMVLALSMVTVTGSMASKAQDVIQLEAPYPHTKGGVTFSHKKHNVDYKISCGECHHDDQGKPLTNLKDGDAVKKCFECHKKPGEIKGKEAKGLSDKEKLAYHANAMHENCVGCHKKFNKEKNSKAAPQQCKDCHPKDKDKDKDKD
ncbi:MAG: cytochrome c3 family protein [Desulfobacteraceae bacterium]|nr:cytochrome c3 family protein [Desulfobacteraceae bacterium]